jgi:hypothetical protein
MVDIIIKPDQFNLNYLLKKFNLKTKMHHICTQLLLLPFLRRETPITYNNFIHIIVPHLPLLYPLQITKNQIQNLP